MIGRHTRCFPQVRVIGRGRVGAAIHARLTEQRPRGRRRRTRDLVLLCVPDSAIAGVAAAVAPGPWIAHVSGATPLSALAPHERRFGLHPLQTFTRARGPEQLDGAWARRHRRTPTRPASAAHWLADRLGLRPFDIRDESRVLYHAGAAMASNFLVTLYRAAARLLESAGAPPEALLPLMRRTIDNGFELTGPIARGDMCDRRRAPRGDPSVRAGPRSALPGDGAGDAAMTTLRTVADLRRALAPHRTRATIALVPTMGALHAGHVALFDAARRARDVVVASIFVNPSQFGDPADLARYPRDEAAGRAPGRRRRRRFLFRAGRRARSTRRDSRRGSQVDGPAQDLEGAHRPGHFRGVATICTKLFNIVAPHIAFFGQKDAQQVAVDPAAGARSESRPRDPRRADRARPRRPRAVLAQRAPVRRGALPRAGDSAGPRRGPDAPSGTDADPVAAARAVLSGLPGVDIDYVAIADFEGQPTLAIAARVGAHAAHRQCAARSRQPPGRTHAGNSR